jgi:DNA polymerase-1
VTTATVVRLPTGPARAVLLLKRALREATALGAHFRITGADVECDGLDNLPDMLRDNLASFAAQGLLRSYLGGDEADDDALDLLDVLDVEAVLVETREELRAAIRALEFDKRHNNGAVAIDIETTPQPGQGAPRPSIHINVDGALSSIQPEPKDRTGLDPQRALIATLQFHAGGTSCFVCRGDALKLVLGSHWLRRQWLIAHNAGFELIFLRHHSQYVLPAGRPPLGRYDCSMQAAGLLLGVQKRSLANTAKARLNLDVPKAHQTSHWGADHLSTGQIAYAASDAILVHRLWPLLQFELQRTSRWDAYELQRRVIPAVADMRLRGLGFDEVEHARQIDAWTRELTEARREYHRLTGNPPPAKPAEVRTRLTTVLEPVRLASWPRTATGELSIEAMYLKRLVHIDSARPVLALLAREKLLANFGVKLAELISPVTGRLHCDYNIAGSKAGRFTASQPNLQQLPAQRAPEFKRCIRAASGQLLVGCDWSQIEMRAAAWIAHDRALTQVYAEGRDLHAETAARVLGVPIGQVSKEQRQAAKPVNFGAIYGIGPRSLAEDAFANYGVEMSENQARLALDRFFATYSQLSQWRRDHADLCQRRGYVRIGAGRVVEAAWEPSGRLSFPQCCNLPIQGICADAMLRALQLTYTRLRQAKIRGGLIASIHDELLLEVAEDDAEAARQLLEQAMTDAFVATFPGAPANGVATASIGSSWAELKE